MSIEKILQRCAAVTVASAWWALGTGVPPLGAQSKAKTASACCGAKKQSVASRKAIAGFAARVDADGSRKEEHFDAHADRGFAHHLAGVEGISERHVELDRRGDQRPPHLGHGGDHGRRRDDHLLAMPESGRRAHGMNLPPLAPTLPHARATG